MPYSGKFLSDLTVYLCYIILMCLISAVSVCTFVLLLLACTTCTQGFYMGLFYGLKLIAFDQTCINTAHDIKLFYS